MEKSFGQGKFNNSNTFRSAASQMMGSTRADTGYPNTQWEDQETQK